MKGFFMICFLAIFAVGADEEIDWFEFRSKIIDMPSYIKFPAFEEIAQENIFYGKETAPHSLPYQVGLRFESSLGQFGCSGALITPEFIVTVAHCADKMEGLTVFLGAHNITKRTDGELIIKVPKSNFIIHKEWNAENSSDDIALIRLPRAIQLSKIIKTISPPRSLSQSELEGSYVIASGWGQYTSVPSPLLHYASLKVSSENECKRYFQSNVRPTNICTNNVGKPNCMGSSGDPLVYVERDGSRILIGLLSFLNFTGCSIGWPTVFTYIPAYLDWIASHAG